jgi:hypothetical protein
MAKHFKKYHLSFVLLTALSLAEVLYRFVLRRDVSRCPMRLGCVLPSVVEQQFFLGTKKEQAASVVLAGYTRVGRREDPTISTIGGSPVSSKSR